MSSLQTPWQLSHSAGEPHAVIRVQNLQVSLRVGRDAWGRQAMVQPVLISIALSLREPFESASNQDAVNKSTVHYGTLGKAVLEVCGHWNKESAVVADGTTSMRALLSVIVTALTGEDFGGGQHGTVVVPEADSKKRTPVIPISILRSVEVKATLPKASLVGSAISVSGTKAYQSDTGSSNTSAPAHSIVLALHDLRIPTLIGVNANERLAKQIVVAGVEIERWSVMRDTYNELEEIVFKTIEESSFQTLEALSLHLIRRIIKYFIIPHFNPTFSPATTTTTAIIYPRIRTSLAKPTAVTFADAPLVEMSLDSDPSANTVAREVWDESSHDSRTQEWRLPFPLSGRLDEWIAKHHA